MSYQLDVSRKQLERFVKALKVLDIIDPLPGWDEVNAETATLDDWNMAGLAECLEQTLLEPESPRMLHGICL